MATEQEASDAVVALLNTLGGVAYDRQDVPTPLPDWYTAVSVTRRYGGEQRGSGERDGTLWRITLTQVGKRLQQAQHLRAKSVGLEGATVTVAGQVSTPIEFETANIIAPDDGWFSGSENWTLALI